MYGTIVQLWDLAPPDDGEIRPGLSQVLQYHPINVQGLLLVLHDLVLMPPKPNQPLDMVVINTTSYVLF